MPDTEPQKKDQRAETSDSFLFVGNPDDPTTWFFRIRNETGELDFSLMDKVKACLQEGSRQDIFDVDAAWLLLRKLKAFYDSHPAPQPPPHLERPPTRILSRKS